MRRSPETGGRSRRRRDGLFAKEHGGETTKLSGSSRDVDDYLRALACSRHQRVAVPANRRLNNLREMSRSITRDNAAGFTISPARAAFAAFRPPVEVPQAV